MSAAHGKAGARPFRAKSAMLGVFLGVEQRFEHEIGSILGPAQKNSSPP